MDPSKRVALFLLVAAAIFSCSPKRQRAAVPRPIVAPPSHPNVLLIVIDTLRHDDSGVGSPSASSTSTLQRLASRAVMFDHSYSTFDETIHSHFSLLTGFVRGSGTPLDHPENAMAMQLKRVGYTTIGVAANGNLAGKILPVVRGFDRYTCMYDQWYPLPEKQQATFLPEINARIDAWHGRHDPWNQFMIFSNAGRVMERLRADIAAARQPFFAFVNLMETHDPYFPDPAIDSPEADGKAGVPAGFDADMRFRTIPPKYADGRLATRAMRRVIAEDLKAVSGRRWSLAYDLTPENIALYRRRYRAEIREVETHIDKLYTWLSQKELLESTIVIITADHGESFGERGFMSHALNGKGDREATQRVPLLFLFPRAYNYRALRVPVMTTSADLAPTIYDYTGVDWSALASSTDVGNFGKSLRYYIDGTSGRRNGAVAAPARSALSDDERSRIDGELRDRLRALGYIQ